MERKQARRRSMMTIIVSLAAIVGFGVPFALAVHEQTMSDAAVRGNGSRNIRSDATDPVEKLLAHIRLDEPEEALAYFDGIAGTGTLDAGTEAYFRAFRDYWRGTSRTLTTEHFIKDGAILYYFRKAPAEQRLEYAAIVPYFLIKHRDAASSFQKHRAALYKAYLDVLVDGRVSLDAEAANVACLYVYARYEAAQNGTTDFVSLHAEIGRFLGTYQNDLGENGRLSIQRDYLEKARDVLRRLPRKRGLLARNRILPYSLANL